MNKLKTMFKNANRRMITLTAMFLLVLITMCLLNPAQFVTVANFKNVMMQIAENGCFATAYFLVFVCGGFNFACVMIGNLSGIVLTMVCQRALGASLSPALAAIIGVLAALAVGAACGSFMAFFVHKFKIPPLMVTICSSTLFQGIGFVLTKGQSALAPSVFVKMGALTFFGFVPVLILIMLACFFITNCFLRKTRLGWQARLYGLNREANRYTGISNARTLQAVYILSGLLSAVGGIIVLSKYGSVKPDYGTSLTTTIILIVMLSGITIGTGNETVLGVLIALVTVQLLSSGLSIAGINANITTFLYGVMLLVVVFITTKGYEKFECYRRWTQRRLARR